MPKRLFIEKLPDSFLRELNSRLVSNGFGDFDGLTDWLKNEGYEVSRSSIHR